MANQAFGRTEDLLFGSGELYISLNDDEDGWKHLGNVDEFVITTTVDSLEKNSSMNTKRELQSKTTTALSVTAEATLTEYDYKNVAMALFGKTASQWRRETDTKGMSPNIRDYASAEELVVLINLEDTNADLIAQGLPQSERLKILREKAYRQLELLRSNGKVIENLKQSLIETVKDTEGGNADEV